MAFRSQHFLSFGGRVSWSFSAINAASTGKMDGILDYNDEPLVSSDYKGNPHSCIIDGLSTIVMANRMVKVMGWYDNEWGYSCRTADLAALMAEKGI